MSSIKKTIFIALGWLSLSIFGGAIIYAASSYRSDPGSTITVNEQGVCKKVINNGSLGRSYFVPTNTATEWSNFRSADSYLTDISLGECAVNLVYNVHTDIQCTAAGGTVVDDGAGNKMCKFGGASCPGGWTRYQNWSTTSETTGSYNNGTCPLIWSRYSVCSNTATTCFSGKHSTFSNAIEEIKTCIGSKRSYGTVVGGRNIASCNSDNIGSVKCGSDVTVTATRTEIGCY